MDNRSSTRSYAKINRTHEEAMLWFQHVRVAAGIHSAMKGSILGGSSALAMYGCAPRWRRPGDVDLIFADQEDFITATLCVAPEEVDYASSREAGSLSSHDYVLGGSFNVKRIPGEWHGVKVCLFWDMSEPHQRHCLTNYTERLGFFTLCSLSNIVKVKTSYHDRIADLGSSLGLFQTGLEKVADKHRRDLTSAGLAYMRTLPPIGVSKGGVFQSLPEERVLCPYYQFNLGDDTLRETKRLELTNK